MAQANHQWTATQYSTVARQINGNIHNGVYEWLLKDLMFQLYQE